MSRFTTTILAIAALSLAGFGTAAFPGPQPGEAAPAIERSQATAEATMNTRSRSPARASARAEASSRSQARASAGTSAGATISGDNQSECATEATATVDSGGRRITVREVRRFRGEDGGCSSTARATSDDAPPDAETK